MGVVEAKRTRVGPTGVLAQAERYARGLEDGPFDFDGFRVPFLYATNGETIWHRDVRDRMNRSRMVAGFHTPEALAERLGHDVEAACETLHRIPAHHDAALPAGSPRGHRTDALRAEVAPPRSDGDGDGEDAHDG